MKNLYLLLAFSLILTHEPRAQEYQFSTTVETYREIDGAFPVKDEFDSSSQFGVNLAGDFIQLYGHKYELEVPTPLIIMGDGVISAFDPDADKAAFIYGFRNQLKSKPNGQSLISMVFEGQKDMGIMKVQYADVGLKGAHDSIYLNFQIWCYQQSGDIEIHFGPNNLTGNLPPAEIGLWQTPLDTNSDEGLRNLLLSGDPQSPTPNIDVEEAPQLNGFPQEGRVYRFDYNISSTTKKPLAELSLYPNPANDYIKLKAGTPVSQIEIYSMNGKLLKTIKEPTSMIDIAGMPEGCYMLKARLSNGNLLNKKIIITR